jgi:hypothetical protein
MLLWKDSATSRLFARTHAALPPTSFAPSAGSAGFGASCGAAAGSAGSGGSCGAADAERSIVVKLFVDRNLMVVTGDRPPLFLKRLETARYEALGYYCMRP